MTVHWRLVGLLVLGLLAVASGQGIPGGGGGGGFGGGGGGGNGVW